MEYVSVAKPHVPVFSAPEEHASVLLAKDGHVAYLSISKVGKLPEAHVRLLFHGNFDTRTLPRTPLRCWRRPFWTLWTR